MSVGKVDDVNIIADTGAVWGGIIGAKDFTMIRLPERDFQDVGNEVSLDAVILAKLGAGAGGVEIAEGDKFEPVNLLIPEEHLFEHELGLAVGINGTLREILCH